MTRRKTPTATNAPAVRTPAWDQTHGTYLAGRAALDGVEQLAIDMANKWGVGRLRLLVNDELRERFDRQRYKLAAAIQGGDLASVKEEAARMARAWHTLDCTAMDAGAQPLAPDIWEATLDDGTVLAIVREPWDAGTLRPEGRKVVVYTLDEVAKILSGYADFTRIKIQWPGAEVTVVRHHVPDPLDQIPAPTDLDDPLDDPVPQFGQ